MKKTIIALLILSCCQIISAQTKTEVLYGELGREDYANDIIENYDKGYLVSAGFNWELGWNIKTDINLEPLWDNELEFPGFSVYNSSVIMDSLGNYYVCGSIMGWPFVIKMNYCYQKQWCRILKFDNDFNYGSGVDIALSPSNEIVVLALYDSDDEIDQIHLIGLSGLGDVLWKRPYASKNDYPWIAEAAGYAFTEINNDYYISGFCYWPYPDDPDHVFLRPLFIGIDSLFNEKWILPFYALDSVYGDAFKTIALSDSVLMGVGVRRAANSANEDNAILMFYNSNGEELGYSEISNDQIGPDIQGSDIRNVIRINDTLFMTASQFGPDFSANPLGELVIDTLGNIYDLQSHPNTIAVNPGLIKTYDNNYVIATSIKENGGSNNDIYLYKIDENLNDVPFDPTPHNYDSLCPGGIQSGTTDLSDCLVWTNIGDAPGPAEYYESVKWVPIKVWPNPTSTGQVSFGFENTGYFSVAAAASAPPYFDKLSMTGGRLPTLAIFNIVGEKVHGERIYRYQEETTVNIQSWKKGMYFAVVYNEGKVVGKCKFVVR